ncbi:MAG: PDZ domain-containing protein [Gemmataceae bacterium]|nr:PDZ domain-containing protein [Gemmataceae bacterium]
MSLDTKIIVAHHIAGVDHGLRFEEKVIAETGDRQRVVVKAAAHAELKVGDEIRLVADCQIVNGFDIERSLWHSKPGQKIEVEVIRQGQPMTVTMTLAASQGAGTAVALVNELPANNTLFVADKNVREANQR